MKKNTLSLAFLVVSTALVTACEKGGPRTPPDAVLKARCESPKAFNTRSENLKLANDIVQNRNVKENQAIRTYITKFEISKDTEKDIVPAELKNMQTLLNPNNAVLASTAKADAFFAKSAIAQSINVETKCEDLTASVSGPGFEIIGMTIKKVDINEIELEKEEMVQVDGKPVMQIIKISIKKSASLRAEDQELATLLDDKKAVIKNKHLEKEKLKNAKKQQIARGNVVTKVSIDITNTLLGGGKRAESYVIEQRAGELYSESVIEFDPSVLKMIEDRTSVAGTPDFITIALVASAEKDASGQRKGVTPAQESIFKAALNRVESDEAMKVDAISGGRLNAPKDGEDEAAVKKLKSISEELVVSQLIKNLDSAAGLPSAPSDELKPVTTFTSVSEEAVKSPTLAETTEKSETQSQASATLSKKSVGPQAE